MSGVSAIPAVAQAAAKEAISTNCVEVAWCKLCDRFAANRRRTAMAASRVSHASARRRVNHVARLNGGYRPSKETQHFSFFRME